MLTLLLAAKLIVVMPTYNAASTESGQVRVRAVDLDWSRLPIRWRVQWCQAPLAGHEPPPCTETPEEFAGRRERLDEVTLFAYPDTRAGYWRVILETPDKVHEIEVLNDVPVPECCFAEDPITKVQFSTTTQPASPSRSRPKR